MGLYYTVADPDGGFRGVKPPSEVGVFLLVSI